MNGSNQYGQYQPRPQPFPLPPGSGFPPPPPVSAGGYPPGGYTLPGPNGVVQFPGIGSVEVAAIWQRAIARCIDAAICLVVISVPVVLGVISLLSSSDSDTSSGEEALVWIVLAPIVTVAFAVFYEWLLVGLWGATFGKMAMHIRVVNQSTGNYIGLGPAFVRHLVILGPALLPYVGVLASLVVLISPLFDNSGRLQGWHDKAANDLVIKY